MKRKEKKAILLKLHQKIKLLPTFVDDTSLYPGGFCSLIDRIGAIGADGMFDIIYKYMPHIKSRGLAYWFPAGDWKIRLSFLEEVMKIELNPFYKLMYKLGLYKFKY